MFKLCFCFLTLHVLLLSEKVRAQAVRPIPAKGIFLAVIDSVPPVPVKVISPVVMDLPVFTKLVDVPPSDSVSSATTSARHGIICYSYEASKYRAPLYVINGKVRKSWQTRNMKLSQIETIEVLREKQAVAIYGLQGRNGVILIKTKENSWLPLR